MKQLILLEELGMFLLAILGFIQLHFAWWLFPALLLLPDLSMLGYAINKKIGAAIYNIIHHKAIAIIIFVIGFYLQLPVIQLIGIILFAHSCMDRIFGYGLKYNDSFNHTHLGMIGKNK
jgi:hypothetical protein